MSHAVHYAIMESPIGALTLASTDKGLAAIHFGAEIPRDATVDEAANREVIEQLQQYFAGERTHFELPLDVQGTPFQMDVWRELQKIPYGETVSYGAIAKSLGKPGASRAVGMANHDNPVAVVIPCHRVVGADGSLTGYAGGLHIKQQLLAIETQTGKQGQILFT